MLEGGRSLGFALESLEALGVFGQLARQDLERHPALELEVIRQVDLSHSTLTELLEDPIVKKLSPDQVRCEITSRLRRLERASPAFWTLAG